jgi:hypothetical protein
MVEMMRAADDVADVDDEWEENDINNWWTLIVDEMESHEDIFQTIYTICFFFTSSPRTNILLCMIQWAESLLSSLFSIRSLVDDDDDIEVYSYTKIFHKVNRMMIIFIQL